MTQLNAGIYSVRVKVTGGCYSDYAQIPVYVILPYPGCSSNSNELNLTGFPTLGFSNSQIQFGIGASGKYEVICSKPNAVLHFKFTTITSPVTGIYKLHKLVASSKDDEAELSLTYGGDNWKVSNGNAILFINNSGKLELEFCNLFFTNQTTGQQITGCSCRMDEP